MKPERIRIHILTAIGASLGGILLLSIFCMQTHQRQDIQGDVAANVNGFQKLFQTELNAEAELYRAVLDSIEEQPSLKKAWLARDREELFRQAVPLFEELCSEYRATHLYFIGLDKVCFLRVHQEERHGDTIDRVTLDEAVREGKTAEGIELGPLGTFTLRVVRPWRIDGKLAGYIEIGEEINHIVPKIKGVLDADIVFLVKKDCLDRSKWEKGMEMLGRKADWDQFPNHVVVESTIGAVPLSLKKEMARHIASDHKKHQFEMVTNHREYMCGFVPLLDAGNNEVGEVIVLSDVTIARASAWRFLWIVIGVCVLVGAFLLGFLYLYIGHIQKALVKNDENLRSEIEQRERANEALDRQTALLNETQQLARVGGWQWNVEQQTMSWTDELYRIHGFSPDEFGPVAPKHIARGLECYDPEDRPIIKAASEQCVADGTPYDLEFPITAADGAQKWIRATGQAVLENDRIVRVFGNVIDITKPREAEQCVRENEKKLQNLFDSMQEGIFYQRANGNLFDPNPAALEMLGVTKDEFLRRKCQSSEWSVIDEEGTVVSPEDYPSALALRTGQVVEDVTLGVYTSDKEEPTWITVNVVPQFHDGESKPCQVFVTMYDVSERRKAQHDYRMLFDEMQLGFAVHEIICDDEGQPVDYRFLSVNPMFGSLTGLKAKDLVGKRVLDVLPNTEKSWIERYGQVAITGEPVEFENYSRELKRYFSVHVFQPIVGQFAVMFEDVTERKEMIQELHESEERFKALHNASFGGITIHDKGIILECNQGLAEMTGYSLSELVGMDGLLLIAEDSRALVMAKIQSGYEKSYEAMGLRKNGEEYPVRLEARNVPYKGKPVRTVEFRDITEHKRSEAENAKLQGQLNQMQKMESVGRLAGGVAHDFNNMLGVILGRTEMAMDSLDATDSNYQDFMEIKKAGERSADITRQLLAFARKQTVTPKNIDLNCALEGMLQMLRRLMGEHLDLVFSPHADLWDIKIDPSQLDQIVVNLCVNARDAIVDTGNITIETENVVLDETYGVQHADFAPGEYVLLSVSDDGCGMDQETQKRIFEPFFTTKEMGKGTGLGLATVYGIVKQNNGFINVYSELGHGTRFSIYLPRHAGEMKKLSENGASNPISTGKETILLVEDEPSILEVATMMLERMGYTVLATDSPVESIQLAKSHSGNIDLLMTDVIMPEMNGHDVAKQVTSLCPDIRCLFMSGYTADVIAQQGVLDPDVHFIHKPFSMQDLGIKLKEALNQK